VINLDQLKRKKKAKKNLIIERKTGNKQPTLGNKRPSECAFFHDTGHQLLYCPDHSCRSCEKKSPRHYASDCFKNPNHNKALTRSTMDNDLSTMPSRFSQAQKSTTFTSNDTTELMKQMMCNFSHTMDTALAQGTSWLFDAGCCNHMTQTVMSLSQRH
ncbi:hypothetical protein Ccrd_002901, partial [Cynara cardunculus var. scolymus]